MGEKVGAIPSKHTSVAELCSIIGHRMTPHPTKKLQKNPRASQTHAFIHTILRMMQPGVFYASVYSAFFYEFTLCTTCLCSSRDASCCSPGQSILVYYSLKRTDQTEQS